VDGNNLRGDRVDNQHRRRTSDRLVDYSAASPSRYSLNHVKSAPQPDGAVGAENSPCNVCRCLEFIPTIVGGRLISGRLLSRLAEAAVDCFGRLVGRCPSCFLHVGPSRPQARPAAPDRPPGTFLVRRNAGNGNENEVGRTDSGNYRQPGKPRFQTAGNQGRKLSARGHSGDFPCRARPLCVRLDLRIRARQGGILLLHSFRRWGSSSRPPPTVS
jgi:hypothetical protein